MDYLFNNWLELFGVITSIIYLYFSINRKAWLWLLGLISSGTYVLVFFEHSLYADMILNSYYVIISIYGWFKWTLSKEFYHEDTHQVDVARVSRKEVYRLSIFWLIIFTVIFIPVNFLPKLLNINSASFPFIDSFLTASCFVATWMLAKRYIEQWYIWVFVNGAYTIIYIYKGLYFTIILSVVYTAMSVVGYIKWNRELENKKSKNKEDLTCKTT
jgi:nicotinamide mononucleotide transporter